MKLDVSLIALSRIWFCFHVLRLIYYPQIELDNTGFGNDLESTRDAIDYHKQVHLEIMHFRKQVDECIAQKVSNDNIVSDERLC